MGLQSPECRPEGMYVYVRVCVGCVWYGREYVCDGHGTRRQSVDLGW